MSNEVIELEIKANVKPATKQVDEFTESVDNAKDAQKELNEQISIQNKVLNDLEKELVELKAQQDKIPKGAFYAGMADLNKKIKETEKNLKLEKIGLKDLENQQKDNNRALKEQAKDLKEVNKEATDSIGNFRVMGVSLNGVKSAFGKIIPIAKAMFGTIKAGILSTGIGALLIAFGSLVTYFTSTKRGADQLSVILAGLGAAFNVVRDRIVLVGEAISLAFSGKWVQAGEKIKESVGGIIDEIKKEVAVMTALEKRVKALRDAEIAFTVQRAETRKEIEKARLLAEDETKSQEVRIEALKKALKLEQETTDKELELAREKVAIQEEQMDTAENKVEAEKKLADLRADVINKETKSFRLQKRVKTEINELEREIEVEEKQRSDKKLKQIADEKKALEELYDMQIAQADAWLKKAEKDAETEIQIKQALVSAIGNGIGQVSNLMEEGSAAQKTLALTEIGINTAVGLMQGLNIAQKATIAAGPAGALAFPLFYATQIAAVLGAVGQAKQVLGAGGGGSTGTITPNLTGSTPSPEMLSGKFELGNVQEQQPVQAYVVTDSLTDNQNKLAYIRRRATI